MSVRGSLGFYNTSSTRTHVRFGFSTHEAAGANVAPNSAFEAADLRIYKATDGAALSATQRSSANGITMTSPFDSLTGVHTVDIDLTDNTDAGFYASGCYYEVWLCPDETVDSQTITGICLASFEIGVAKADVTQLGGDAQSATDLKDFADAGYDPSTNKVEGVKLVDTLTTYTGNTPQTGDSYAIVNSGTHGNAALKTLIDVIDGIVDSILDDTGTSGVVLNAAGLATDAVNEIRNAITGGAYALDTDANGRIRIVDGTGTGELSTTSGLLDWNPAWDAEVQSEAEDALVVHRLDELLNADSDIDGLAPPTVGSVFHELLSKTAGSFTYDQTTDSLEALRDRGDAAWITATGFSTHSAADVWAVATRVLTAGTNIALAKGTGVTGFNDLDAAGIRTAVGLATANLDTQLDALPTANEVRNAVTGGAYALDTDANGRVRIVDGTGAGEIDTTSGGVLVASLATQAKADVNAEVVDAFATDTYAEPSQGTPPATASLSTKLNWLYMAWRNKKTQTSSLLSLFADDASTVAAKSTVSDDGTTFTAGEFTTGA